MSFHADQWLNFFNAVGTWVAGAGTVGAVVVALQLEKTRRRVDITVSVEVYDIITPGGVPPRYQTIGFMVVNMGERAATISSVGWSVGEKGAERLAVQNIEGRQGAVTPKRLEHGERADFMFTLDQTWPAYFVKDFVKDRADLSTLCGAVSTTTSHIVKVVPGRSVLKRLESAFDVLQPRPLDVA